MRLEEVISVEEPLAVSESALLALLLADIERLSHADVAAWFRKLQDEHVRRVAAPSPAADIPELEQFVATALHQWASADLEAVRVLIVRHPRTYFPGFHEPLRLERAYELAMLTRSRERTPTP